MKIIESFEQWFPKGMYDAEVSVNASEEILETLKEYSDKEDIKKLKITILDDYHVFVDYEKLTAKMIKETKRAKYGFKQIFYYRFPTLERMAESIKNVMDNVKSDIERKKVKKDARKSVENPYKVGDILCNSWGYDQTNVDFYQIVKTSGKSVWIKRIAGEIVPGSEGFMSANVKPIKDNFLSDEVMRKTIQVAVGMDPKKATAYIPSKFGHLSLYDSGDKGVYSSWYA